MNVVSLSAALMSLSMVMAAPTFAQTSAAQKQPTQEGGGPSMPMPIARPYNANPSGDPNYKQRTQEGGNSESFECGAPFNANPSGNPDCKQRSQNLTPGGQGVFEASGKQK